MDKKIDLRREIGSIFILLRPIWDKIQSREEHKRYGYIFEHYCGVQLGYLAFSVDNCYHWYHSHRVIVEKARVVGKVVDEVLSYIPLHMDCGGVLLYLLCRT